jgi:hypothetical protein
MAATITASIRWLYLNFKYRFWPLPTDPLSLEKITMALKVPLAFTYKAHGLDVALAQQRIRENLHSFRWSAPLVLTTLLSALVVGTIISESLFLLFG